MKNNIILDYFSNNMKIKIKDYWNKIKTKDYRNYISLDYFLNQIIDPDNSLKHSFSDVILVDVNKFEMADIFMEIKKHSDDNVILITEWSIPYPGDEYNYLINKFPLGAIIPAYPYPENRVSWMPKTKPHRVYYYEVDDKLFKNKEELNDCLEEFRGFNSYSGYILNKDKINVFKKYLINDKKDMTAAENFKESVIGFFSGVHECDTLVILKRK